MTDLEAIEFVFKDWLHTYGTFTAQHWDKLSIPEINILCEAQWQAFLENYENLMKKPLSLVVDSVELDDPKSLGGSLDELKQRGFERINDPRRKANE